MSLERKKLFAKYLTEGFSGTESFRKAFDSTKYNYDTMRARSSQLKNDKVVVEEIARLQSEMEKSEKKVEKYEVDHAMEELEEAYKIAKKTGNAANMIKSTELKARIHGLLKAEKQEIKVSTVSTLDIKDLITLRDFLVKEKVDLIEDVEVVNEIEPESVEDAEVVELLEDNGEE